MTRLLASALLFASLVPAGLAWFAGPAQAQDAAEMVVRMNRLEGQVRQLSGSIEQLQYENRTLKEQVRKFQEDVEYRFQERSGSSAKGSSSPAPSPSPAPAAPSSRSNKRSDAYDPGQGPGQGPADTGAPMQLGTTPPSAALGEPRQSAAAGRPSGRSPDGIASLLDDEEPAPGAAPLDLNGARATPPAPRSPSIATGSNDPRGDYDTAYAYLLQRQYEQAEMGFRRFLQSHPRDRLAPEATYWLGESYLQRSRPREAAEQFLKVSTDFGSSAKAPDALLKLGIALNALGARDQACATFAELGRKYPQASSTIRSGVDREQRRARCTG